MTAYLSKAREHVEGQTGKTWRLGYVWDHQQSGLGSVYLFASPSCLGLSLSPIASLLSSPLFVSVPFPSFPLPACLFYSFKHPLSPILPFSFLLSNTLYLPFLLFLFFFPSLSSLLSLRFIHSYGTLLFYLSLSCMHSLFSVSVCLSIYLSTY